MATLSTATGSVVRLGSVMPVCCVSLLHPDPVGRALWVVQRLYLVPKVSNYRAYAGFQRKETMMQSQGGFDLTKE